MMAWLWALVLLMGQPKSDNLTARAAWEMGKEVVPAIALEDQFEGKRDVAELRGSVVVLIYGDRRSANANKELGEWLHVHFHPSAKGLPPAEAQKAPVRPLPGLAAGQRSPEVATVAIASIGPVPALVRGLIRRQIRGASPDVPVLLDFTDLMSKQFGLTAGVPNVVILDTVGRVRYIGAGPFSREQQASLVTNIETWRREAVTPNNKP